MDPSLVERLMRLLPRPDAPLDTVIQALLEKHGLQAQLLEAVQALRRQLEGLAQGCQGTGRAERLAADIRGAVEAAVSQLRQDLRRELGLAFILAGLLLMAPEARDTEAREGAHSEAAPGGALAKLPKTGRAAAPRGGWLARVLEAARAQGGCLRYGEIARIAGTPLGGRQLHVLKQAGLRPRGDGTWCLSA